MIKDITDYVCQIIGKVAVEVIDLNTEEFAIKKGVGLVLEAIEVDRDDIQREVGLTS